MIQNKDVICELLLCGNKRSKYLVLSVDKLAKNVANQVWYYDFEENEIEHTSIKNFTSWLKLQKRNLDFICIYNDS